MWPYTPANSPLPLPGGPVIVTSQKIHYLHKIAKDTPGKKPLTLEEIQNYCSHFATEELTIDQILTQAGGESLEHRKPFLMLGELANPFQLNRLNIGPMPIFIVRLENLCRTYCDGIDSRMIQPGIHHVTLARSEGWWETAHLGMATTEQMKKMVSWLSNGRKGDWKPVKPAEGGVRFEDDYNLESPSFEALSWDGDKETTTLENPEPTGPALDISQVMVPVHTKWGCYDNRGKITRCAHVKQRDFHTNYFRRGSSKKWQDILNIQ